MSDAVFVTAAATVLMALINAVASVLMLWIRARYRWSNGEDRPKSKEDGA